jgi:hypothetical protein
MPIWLAKIIGKRIVKAIKHRIDLKKIDDYVNKPNLLKKEIAQMRKNMNKNSKYTEELEKEVAILRKDSHPPIFGKSDIRKIEKRLKKLERKKGE